MGNAHTQTRTHTPPHVMTPARRCTKQCVGKESGHGGGERPAIPLHGVQSRGCGGPRAAARAAAAPELRRRCGAEGPRC